MGEEKTPLVRKIIIAGDSRAMTLPSTWLAFHEEQAGQRITHVSVSVKADGSLIIEPIIAKKNPHVTVPVSV